MNESVPPSLFEAVTRRGRLAGPAGCALAGAAALLLWLGYSLYDADRNEGSWLMGFISPPAFILVVIGAGVVKWWIGERRRREFPDEPWMWDRRWNRGGARSLRAGRLLRPLGAVGLLVFLAAGLGFAALVLELPALYGIVVPACLLLLAALVLAFRATGADLKYGGSFLRYRTFPFFLGERLAATLEGIDRLRGFTRMTIVLRCVLERTVGSGKSAHVEREVVDAQTRGVAPEDVTFGKGSAAGVFKLLRRSDDAAFLPISFDLPDEDLSTRLSEPPVRKWELEVKAETPGLDYEATFLVPVYARRSSRSERPA